MDVTSVLERDVADPSAWASSESEAAYARLSGGPFFDSCPLGCTASTWWTALSELAPFEVTSPPSDVRVYGYRGKHLELIVPDMAFDRCDAGDLRSWIAPMDAAEEGEAFYGYTGPGYREEFWILDVDGTRLMIAAGRSPGSPPEDLAELRAILDSIRIEP